MSKTIIISSPYIENKEGQSFLCSKITLPAVGEKVFWFSVKSEYEKYLVDDRADAFLVPMLTYAMKNGFDIKVDGAVSKKLLYQIRHYLIAILPKEIKEFQKINVEADYTDDELPCEGAVGLSWSGGVDSMYSLCDNLTSLAKMKITHLVSISCGALEKENANDNLSEKLEKMVAFTNDNIGKDVAIPAIGIDSNYQEIIDETFLATSTYRIAGCALALQKLFKLYIVSSSYNFSSNGFYVYSCAHYESYLLDWFSTDNLSFALIGEEQTRVGKTKKLAGWDMARKHLHPCVEPLFDGNCNVCPKCYRTMSTLYVIGEIENFDKIFDIKKFNENKNDIFATIYADRKNEFMVEIIEEIEQRGIEIPKEVITKAKILETAKKVATKNKEIFDNDKN